MKTNGNIMTFLIDKNKVKWIGTAFEGLVKYNDTTWTSFNVENSSLPFNSINDIFFKDNKVMIATEAGLATFDEKTNKWQNVFDNEDEYLDIKKIKEDFTTNNIWVLSPFALNYLKDNKWTTLELPKKIKSSLTSMDIDANGTLFVGSFNTGLHTYNNKQQWQEFKFNKQINNSVISILISSNILFIGTNGYGLAIYNMNTNDFKIYNLENSNIPNNWIYDISTDNDNNVWIATSKGIAKLKIK